MYLFVSYIYIDDQISKIVMFFSVFGKKMFFIQYSYIFFIYKNIRYIYIYILNFVYIFYNVKI